MTLDDCLSPLPLVAVLRGICKYIVQTNATFSQSYMEETLNRYPLIAGLLVELFEPKFDPQREDPGKTVLEGEAVMMVDRRAPRQ